MADPVTIIENQAAAWAQEETLQRLVSTVGKQNELLKRIGKITDVNLDNIDEFNERLNISSKSLAESTKAQLKATLAARDNRRAQEIIREEAQRANDRYKKSVDDLRTSLTSLSRATPQSALEGLSNSAAVWGGKLSTMGGHARIAGLALTGLSKAVAVATAGFAYYKDGFDALVSMNEAGVLFNGSVEQMRYAVGRAGSNLQAFGNLVNQYGQTISGVGEQAFTESARRVQDLTRRFGHYGLTTDKVNEGLAQYLDIMRSGGLAYTMEADQREEATARWIAETMGMARLTGRQRKQIEDDQKKAMASAQVDLAIREMRAKGDTEGADAMARMVQNLSPILGPEMAKAAAGMQMGVVPVDPNIRALMTAAPGTFERLGELTAQFRNLSPEEIRRQGVDILAGMQGPETISQLRLGATTQRGPVAGAATMFTGIMQGGGDNILAARARGEIPAIEDIMTGRRGTLDRAATAMGQAQGDAARITGDFAAALAKATEKLGIFSNTLPLLAEATGAGAQISSGLASAVTSMSPSGLIATLIGGGLAYKGIQSMAGVGLGAFARAAGIGATATPPTGPGPIPTPGAPGTVPTPGAPGTVPTPGAPGTTTGPGGRGLRLGRGVGLAGAGLALAAPVVGQAAAGMGASPKWSNALSGAGMGAGLGMMLGPWGALLGGALGGAAGYMGLLGGGEQEAAAQAQIGGGESQISEYLKSIDLSLSSTGHIKLALDAIALGMPGGIRATPVDMIRQQAEMDQIFRAAFGADMTRLLTTSAGLQLPLGNNLRIEPPAPQPAEPAPAAPEAELPAGALAPPETAAMIELRTAMNQILQGLGEEGPLFRVLSAIKDDGSVNKTQIVRAIKQSL